MSRARAVLYLHAGIGVTALGTLLGAAAADAQTVPPPTAAPIVVPGTTVPGAVVTPPPAAPVATTVPPAGSRGGASEGGVVKPAHETWSARRIVTTTGLAIIALASIGYVYGKVRSAPPRHPDLTRQPEESFTGEAEPLH